MRLVEFRAFAKHTGKRVERLRGVRRGQERHDTGVSATAEIGTDGNIAPELDPDRVFQEPAHFDNEVFLGVVAVDLEARLPETLRAPVTGFEIDELPMAGAQLANPREHRVLAGHELKRHVFADRVVIRDRGHRRVLEQRLDLRREHQMAVGHEVIQRLDAEVVASDEQRLAVTIVQQEREHPVELLHALRAIGGVHRQDDLGVRGRPEDESPLLQLGA